MFRAHGVEPSALQSGEVPVDIDVTPMDNSKTHKAGVSRTYKGFDGYAPIMAYIGREGFLVDTELREGSQDKQDIQRQVRELKSAGAQQVFLEYEHGDSIVKEQLSSLLETAQAGDTILTLEVSRLARSTKQLCDIIERVKEKRLRLSIVGSINVDCSNGELDPMTNAFIQLSGVQIRAVEHGQVCRVSAGQRRINMLLLWRNEKPSFICNNSCSYFIHEFVIEH